MRFFIFLSLFFVYEALFAVHFTLNTPLADTAIIQVTPVTCYGDSNGVITITATGDNGPYMFSVDSGSTWTVNNVFIDLPANEYDVMVHDNSSNVVISQTVSVPQPTPIITIWDVTPVTCHGFSDASILMTVSSQFPPHEFLWNTGDTSQNLQDISAGDYSVTISNSSGCSVVRSMTIDDPDTLVVSSTQINIVCSYDKGSVDLTVSGGSLPYNYLWSNGIQTQDASDLNAGEHSVQIADHNNCQIIYWVTITQPSSFITVADSVIPVSCYGLSDGSVSIEISGGAPSYSILWSNDSVGLTNTLLSPGTYSVTITDQNACHDTLQYIITQPLALLVSDVIHNPLCYQDSNGYINLNVSGGTPLYQFNWEKNNINIGTQQNLTGISSGVYYVTVSDFNNCLYTDSFELIQPEPLSVSETITPVTCRYGNNGEILVSVSGGTGIYIQYLWYNSQNQLIDVGNPANNLSAGTYMLSVTDNNNCELTQFFNVSEPTIQANFFITNLTCNGAGDGIIDLLVSNHTGPKTYLWSNNETTEDISGLDAGTYSVTITYNSICEISDSITITEPPAGILTVSSSSGFNVCNPNGVVLTAQPGFSSYLWSTNETSSQITISDTGLYWVEARDLNNCKFVDTVQMNLLALPDTQQICLVTVDTNSQKNVIIWTPDTNEAITYYNIYKEGQVAGEYNISGIVPASLGGIFYDNNSAPEISNSKYVITAIDSCGNESEYGTPHNTIFLNVLPGIPNTTMNLGWFDTYQGFDFLTYKIYRSINNGPFLFLDEVSYMVLTYSDLTLPGNVQNVCYRISVQKQGSPCQYDSDIYSETYSNNSCYEYPNSNETTELENQRINISPNPFSDYTTVTFFNFNNSAFITIRDITGKIVTQYNNVCGGKLIIKRADLNSGIYFLEINTDKIFRQVLIVK